MNILARKEHSQVTCWRRKTRTNHVTDVAKAGISKIKGRPGRGGTVRRLFLTPLTAINRGSNRGPQQRMTGWHPRIWGEANLRALPAYGSLFTAVLVVVLIVGMVGGEIVEVKEAVEKIFGKVVSVVVSGMMNQQGGSWGDECGGK